MSEHEQSLNFEFKHLYVLKRLLVETYRDNYLSNYSFAESIVKNIDGQKDPTTKKEALHLLKRIERLGALTVSLRSAAQRVASPPL